jgi:hypothetical protein
MDLDRPPLYLRSMLSRAARYLDIKEAEGSRLFVGFLDAAGSGQGSRARLALFHVRGWSQIDDDAMVEQLELWDIETRKRIWVMPEPEDASRLLDYSSVTHLLARRSIQGIVTLQRL